MIDIINKKESRPVSIQQCLNGYIVTVGCTTVVFNSLDSLVNELREYFNNPHDYEHTLTAQRYNGYKSEEPFNILAEPVSSEMKSY